MYRFSLAGGLIRTSIDVDVMEQCRVVIRRMRSGQVVVVHEEPGGEPRAVNVGCRRRPSRRCSRGGARASGSLRREGLGDGDHAAASGRSRHVPSRWKTEFAVSLPPARVQARRGLPGLLEVDFARAALLRVFCERPDIARACCAQRLKSFRQQGQQFAPISRVTGRGHGHQWKSLRVARRCRRCCPHGSRAA
jgi:hypothetical protein